jgi:hypothetical protein
MGKSGLPNLGGIRDNNDFGGMGDHRPFDGSGIEIDHRQTGGSIDTIRPEKNAVRMDSLKELGGKRTESRAAM